jgi:RNA-binding protein 26
MPALATRKVASASTAVSALAARQQLLEQKIAEQKTLMSSLEKASAEEKKDIMTKLRKLSDEMTKLTSSSTSSEAETSKASVTNKVEQDKKEKERLDKELEMRKTADETSTTEELKAKLERLKAEVFVSLTDVIRTLTSPYLRLRVWVSMLRFLRPRRRLHTIGVGTVVDHSEEEGTPVAAHPERV